MISITDFLPLVKPKTISVKIATITPMHATESSVCACVMSSTTASGKKSVIEIIKGVDYKTLLFFIGLFVSVAGLEKTGVLNMIANFITSVSEGNIAVIVIVILWLSAITSAFVDNIPFAATMIPVIRAIAATEGMDIGVLAWALSLGTDLGGNATPIGASANVVGTSASAKGGYPIGWGRYCKYCVPATIIVMAVSTAYLFLRYL